jgi:hypothetical protein
MRLFDELNIETQSTCNRACLTCLRQSYPEKAAITGRFELHQMPTLLVESLLEQAAGLGFRGRVCLQHFNEPLQDERIGEFGCYAKGLGQFAEVYLNTNGDYLTPEVAMALDGAFDRLHIALYSGNKVRRAAQYREWFTTTRLTFTGGEHLLTHFSPYANLAAEIGTYAPQPCERECQMRGIIAYNGQMLLCCDDIVGEAEYGLGNANALSLSELWFGDAHRQVIETLAHPGGRAGYAYCSQCPRPNTPYWSRIP